MTDDAVELIAVQNQELASVLGGMDSVQLYIDAVKMHSGMFAELLIVIAGYVNDARAFFGLVDAPAARCRCARPANKSRI